MDSEHREKQDWRFLSLSVGIEFHSLPVDSERNLSSRQLLELCLSAGATQASWLELTERIQKDIRGLIYRRLRLSGLATQDRVDEIVQRTLFKLVADDCRRLREFTFQHENALGPFCRTVAWNVAADYLREIGRKPEVPLPEIDPPDPGPGPERMILFEDVRDYLEKNSSRFESDIFWLYHLSGLTAREISELPDVKLGVRDVEYILWRLMQVLKKKYGGGSDNRPSKKNN